MTKSVPHIRGNSGDGRMFIKCHFQLKIIERLMIGCHEQPSDRAVIKMKRLDSYLNESNSYYPF